MVLLNDFSARDTHPLECMPLGPFNLKNFGNAISTGLIFGGFVMTVHKKKTYNDRGKGMSKN